jgi:peptidyl-prolyl cis-trans isomerase SurA
MLTFFSLSSFAQNKNNSVSNSENIVAEFKGEKITSAEFESAFNKVGIPKKENKNDSLTEKRKFLELYVNYRMKIKDAALKGLDKDPEVIKEYEDYRNNIGANILVEKELLEKGAKELYEKRKIEMRVSQLFIKFDSTKADQGYSKAKDIFNRIKAGEKFEDLVTAYSDQPDAKATGGDLYYLSSGDINVPEIENELYITAEGNICNTIFKTNSGFHILKVTEKKPKRYALDVSHILTLYKTDKNTSDTLAAKNKILEAQEAMKKGMSFEDAAKKYSDDKVSAPKGGELGSVRRGTFIKEFDEKVMNMKEHEISDVIQTSYGFHIIRVNKEIPFPSYAELEESLKKRYQQTTYQNDLEKLVSELKREFNFKLNTSLYNNLIAVKDSFYVGDSLFYANIKGRFKDSLFASVNGKPYVADSVFNYMVNMGDIIAKRYDKKIIDLSYNRYFTALLLSQKALKEYSGKPEFEESMNDYMDGILLFKVSEKEIWGKVKVDTTQIPSFWEQTRENYFVKPRVTYEEIYLTTEKMKDSVYTALREGAGFDTMLKKSERSTSSTPIDKNIDENEQAKRAYNLKNVGDITEPFYFGGGWYILRLDKREEKRLKTLEEAKPEVIAALQEKETKRMEDVYVAKLKEMFNPKIYPENIKN